MCCCCCCVVCLTPLLCHQSIGAIVHRLGEADPAWRKHVVDKLLAFGKSSYYRERITMAKFCGCMAHEVCVCLLHTRTKQCPPLTHSLIPPQMEATIFKSCFLASLLDLARDPCRNVRLAVARLFSSAPNVGSPGITTLTPQIASGLGRADPHMHL